MISMIRDGVQFVIKNDLKTSWGAFIKHDTHPFLQFVKYGFCGVAAVIVHTIFFALTSYKMFPAHEGLVVDGVILMNESGLLQINFVIASTIGFVASNFAAYFTNLWFVFEGGRHHRVLEFVFFTAISSIGFVVGMIISVLQLRGGIGESWAATGTLIITSAIVNFICRKFLIFKT